MQEPFENSPVLRFWDGTVIPAAEPEPPGGSSSGRGGGSEQHWNVVFGRLIDLEEAVLVGDVEIPMGQTGPERRQRGRRAECGASAYRGEPAGAAPAFG